MARTSVLAIALLFSACSPASYPTGTSQRSSGGPSASATLAASASLGTDCGDSRGTAPAPTYTAAIVSIPLGSDACEEFGPLANPQFLDLVNDGPFVAFNARDNSHEGDLWYGDLRTKSVKVVYQAAESPTSKTDIWYPQLASGHLLWLENQHEGPTANDPVVAWSLKDMDVASGKVTVLAHDSMPSKVGKMYVAEIRFDGKRIGLLEALPNGSWQIEIRDLGGKMDGSFRLHDEPLEFALTSDGVLYSSGKSDASSGAIGQMHMWHWTSAGGTNEVGTDVFQINADGDLAAWIVDPIASQHTTGYSQVQRVYVGNPPYTTGKAVSPVADYNPTKGIDGMACGSGTIAWWEREDYDGASLDAMTIWQPGWTSPIQVDTQGNQSVFVSDRGGWLAWAEEIGRENAPLQERIRGVPLQVLTDQRK